MSTRQPVVFVGHGSPMNAIEDTPWGRGWADVGAAIEPRAILVVSAHWYVPGTWVTGNAQPPTIHDFGGFPRALHEVQYPAPGDGALATRVRDLLAHRRAEVKDDWGLDHGAWSVLVHLRPAADLPVVQLSIDRRACPATHLAIGRELAPLRDEGVLILASGNVTHNLHQWMRAYRAGDRAVPAWSASFDADVACAVTQHDAAWLTGALELDDGRLAHPTPDHWFPLLYAMGAADDGDRVSFPVTGFDGGLSMRAIRWGAA